MFLVTLIVFLGYENCDMYVCVKTGSRSEVKGLFLVICFCEIISILFPNIFYFYCICNPKLVLYIIIFKIFPYYLERSISRNREQIIPKNGIKVRIRILYDLILCTAILHHIKANGCKNCYKRAT